MTTETTALPGPQTDELLDYIYENGTIAEGVRKRILDVCNAYAEARVQEALEEAAKEFECRDARNPGSGWYEPLEPAAIIRALAARQGKGDGNV